MTESKNRLTAMTAIAAVLALATPAIAQDAQPAPASTAPDPLGATPPTAEPTPSSEPAPSATTAADPLAATTAVEATPAPATRARTTPRRATATAPATRARSTAREPVAASPTPTSPAPVETSGALAAPLVAATPPAVAAPTPVQLPEAPPAESAGNDVLPLVAAGGLGLLALLGAGVALRRRKRRDEEVEYVAFDEPGFEEQRVPVAFAEPMREPSMTRAPVFAAPVLATPVAPQAAAEQLDAPAASVPDGFDLSRFGPHVQAAYRGPSEDNPSLSLKNRLRRASAMDQMARSGVAPVPPVAPRPLAASTSARDTGAVVSKIRPAPSSSGGFILGGAMPPKRPVTQH